MLPNDFKLAGISFFYSDAIALLQHSPIHRFLYSFPNIRFQQFRIPHLRINTIAEEYIHQAVIRVYPCTSSGKAYVRTPMPERKGRRDFSQDSAHPAYRSPNHGGIPWQP